jgi:hypothetical protein
VGGVPLDDAEGLRRKYTALSTVQFADNVPEPTQVEFLQKLAPYTSALATKQDDIGLIWDPKYDFHLELDNYTPIREKAIRYPPHVERWLKEQLDSMERTGRIERVGADENTPMVTSLVLVPEGQSG